MFELYATGDYFIENVFMEVCARSMLYIFFIGFYPNYTVILLTWIYFL